MNAPNRYRLVRRLGAGAAGAVYLADTAEGQVAIREFQSSAPRTNPYWERERQRFLEGGRSAMTLRHDCIVPVLDVVDEAGDAFIASEYQEAVTLENALAGRRFSALEISEILGQLARTLDFVHDQALVHGDLKPANVFVSRQGIKIADFGISPRAHWEPSIAMPAFLTHAYLSPEHLSGTVSARSDQYSLAAIAYRMYTGQVPPVQTLAGPPVTRVDVTPPSRIRSDVPSSIDGPILRALDRDPEKRFESCRKFYGALGAAMIAPEAAPSARGGIYAIAALVLILAGAGIAFRMLTGHKSQTSETAAVRPPMQPAPKPVVTAKSPDVKTKSTVPAARPSTRSNLTIPSQAKAETTPSSMPQQASGSTVPQHQTAAPATSDPHPAGSVASPRNFTIEVFSRTHRIEEGSSFSFGDPVLGEMGQFDLKAVANADWQQPARTQLRLEWSVDGVPMDGAGVNLAKVVEYRNEPTPGTYKLTLKLDGKPVQSFSFRITP